MDSMRMRQMEFGDTLKRRRRILSPKVSQERVARDLDISTVWVSKIEQGARSPSLGLFYRYTERVGLTKEEQEQLLGQYGDLVTVRFNASISVAQDRQLRRLADLEKIEATDLIRRFIQEGLDRANQT